MACGDAGWQASAVLAVLFSRRSTGQYHCCRPERLPVGAGVAEEAVVQAVRTLVRISLLFLLLSVADLCSLVQQRHWGKMLEVVGCKRIDVVTLLWEVVS